MTISEIRRIIEAARWSRMDLTGGTSEEFKYQAVGPMLRKHIETIKALIIPPRFVTDIARRDEEVEYCNRVITRWESRQ